MFNKLPKKVSLKEFNQLVLPHLRRPIKGPKPKISLYKIFNHVLHVLHTGIQWNQLQTYRNELHWSNVYKWHRRWSEDGSYERLFLASVARLNDKGKLDVSVIHGDGSNTVAKKGERKSVTQGINIRKVRKPWLFQTIHVISLLL